MLSRNILLSKSSFVILIWLTIIAVLVTTVKLPISQIPVLNGIITTSEANQVTDIPAVDLKCMTENIYHEAANESYVGKLAVGQVVLNRVKTQGFPDTICKVIYEGSRNAHTASCQFEWVCGRHNKIDKNSLAWRQSISAATELLNNQHVVDVTEGATSYHADYVNPPWAKNMHKIAQIDRHIFYREELPSKYNKVAVR